MMRLQPVMLLFAFLACLQITLADESKFNEIIKLLADSDQQLKPEAQSYSATVADPNESYSSQGISRLSERSRYAPSSSGGGSSNLKEDDEAKKIAEEEEDKKPDRLAILLADSKFSCEGLKNGYYADESVGCQVFHYCVEGVKHSWQCPENTVFHQIHLNCVPNTQDICSDSSKFHVVNDYLHKELNERGPNNTILYHQRFYPEGFDVSGGDTVTQIFQAQAQAALQKAQERERQRQSDRDNSYSTFEEPPRATRPSRPKSYPVQQSPRSSSKPAYKVVSRPSNSATYAPVSQAVPTKRPTTYSTPEAFTHPAYTESSQDDFNNNEFSPSSSSSSLPSSSSSSGSNFASSSSSGFNSGSVSSFAPSSQSTFSSSSNQPSSSFRASSPSSSRPNYPTRSLGIPIASFRVAPSQGYTGSVAGAESNIHELNVPLVDVPSAYSQTARGFYMI